MKKVLLKVHKRKKIIGSETDENASNEESKEDENTSTEESNANEDTSNEQNETNETTSNEQNGQAENIYTLENYKKSKSIIEKRLIESGIQQYTIRLDEPSGSIVMEVPEDADRTILQNVFENGKVEIKIIETGEIIGDNSSISKVETGIDDTYANYFGSVVKFNMEFSNDAVKKFKEIKNNYVIPTDENGAQKENTIQIYIDGTSILSTEGMTETEFLDSAINGVMPLSIGGYTTDEKQLDEVLTVANCRKVLMENDSLPIEYSAQYTNDIHSNISKLNIVIIFAIIAAVMFIYLVFKFKLKGILSELSIIGFGALLLLVLRYTKVQISIAAIVSMIGMLILQFIYLIKLLNNEKITSKVFTTKTIEFSKILIPAFIMSVTIAFANILEISGFGMVIFWGIILFEIFNNIITRAILTNVKNK